MLLLFFILLLFFCFFFCDDITPVYCQWKITFWIKVLKWNFFVEIVSLSTNLPQQLSHSYSSVLIHVLFFFSFFCLCCFFLMSYTPNFKIFTRITFTYEFLPISFLSCLNAYFNAFFFFLFPAIFTFISRRHRGSPFGLTFYIDGMQDIRLSCCCEYKHKPGHVLGGRNGHFQFVVVEGAAPCYR